MHGTKYLVIIPDGCADEPIPELDHRTPLQAADTPNFDRMAARGRIGLVKTIPEGMPPGSDVALMSILGYDPTKYYTGRAPLEAASLDIPLGSNDVAFRCNLITLEDDTLVDYSAGEIETDQARILIELINEKLGSSKLQFYPGVSYRHVMVWRDGSVDMETTPPHDIQGQSMSAHLPAGEGEEMLRRLICDSMEILDSHEINRQRRDQGKQPGNSIWLWGQGRTPQLPSFPLRFGVTGGVIAAVDLVRGGGKLAGLSAPQVPGATGNLQTNYEGKAQAALDILREQDFVLVHVEAPDEAAHHADIEGKVWAIEQVDSRVMKPILEGLERYPDHRILLISDHHTPISIKTHDDAPVPFVIYSSNQELGQASGFDEQAAQESGLMIEEGHRLIEQMFGI